MDAKELLQVIRQVAPYSCSIDITRPDADLINLNEHGQANRQQPIIRWRDNFELTIDQDGLESLARHLTERYRI